MQKETDDRLQSVLRTILFVCQMISVILFASAARYELTSSSDIDVVVIFHSLPNLKNAQKQLYVKSGALPFPVDSILIDTQNYEQKSQIAGVLFDACNEGRIIFS